MIRQSLYIVVRASVLHVTEVCLALMQTPKPMHVCIYAGLGMGALLFSMRCMAPRRSIRYMSTITNESAAKSPIRLVLFDVFGSSLQDYLLSSSC